MNNNKRKRKFSGVKAVSVNFVEVKLQRSLLLHFMKTLNLMIKNCFQMMENKNMIHNLIPQNCLKIIRNQPSIKLSSIFLTKSVIVVQVARLHQK
jgi:hypothetical protein